jgi:membrane fusion protein (multidrug efflux system)
MTAVREGMSGPIGATAEMAAVRRRPATPLVILGVLGVVVAVVVWRRVAFANTHVTTDNAQVDGHVTAVAPRVPAFVARVLVDDNQAVKAGDTLVVLDDRDFRIRLAQAEADLRTAEAASGRSGRIGQAAAARSATVETASGARANVTAAQATLTRATADLERYQKLVASKIVSAQQLDQAQWVVDNARAALESAERQAAAAASQTDAASAGIQIAEGRLGSARAAVDNARLQLGFTVILAPTSGVIAKRSVETGALVAVGQPLMTVVPDENIWVTANLKETQLAKVAIGNEVEFTVDAYPHQTFKGRVASLSPATGARFALLPPDNATGNFTKVVQRVPVRITIESPKDPARPLRPGMSVDVTIKVG